MSTNLQVTFTIVSKLEPVQKTPRSLAKEFSLNEGGSLVKNSRNLFLDYGTAKTVTVNFAEFPRILDGLLTHQALIHGICAKGGGGDEYEVASRRLLSVHPGAVSRTADNFAWPGSGIVMFDYDVPSDTPPYSRNELIEHIRSLDISLERVPMVWKPSSSSNIVNGGTPVIGLRNQRVYIPVTNTSNIASYTEALMYRAWENGLGHIFISKAGTPLPRCIFDTAVFSPERLDFAAGAVCVKPLHTVNTKAMYISGSSNDYVNCAAPVRHKGKAVFTVSVKSAVNQLQDKIEEARREYANTESTKLAAHNGITVTEARGIVSKRLEFILSGSDVVYDNDMNPINVVDIFLDSDKYNGMTIRDPLEPEYGPSKAKIFVDDSRACVNSFAHGGRVFNIKLSGVQMANHLSTFPVNDIKYLWSKKIKFLDNSAVSVEDVVDFISRTTDTSKTAIRKDVNKEVKTAKRSESTGLSELDLTHHQMAQVAISQVNSQIIGYGGRFYKYGGLCWDIIEHEAIEAEVIARFDGCDRCCRQSDYRAIQKHAYSLVVDAGFFDMVAPRVATLDGVWEFDKESKTIRRLQHDPTHRVRFVLPYNIGDVQESPKIPFMFKRYLDDTFARTEYQIKLVQEIFGAIIFGVLTQDWHKAVLLRGGGNNGKSVMIDILSGLVPPHYTSVISPFQFDNPVFVAELSGKMLNIVSELEMSKKLPGAIFKAVVDNGELTGKRLYAPPFKFPSTAAQVFSSNHDIETTDTSDGMKRRWLILSFDNAVDPDNTISQLGKLIVRDEGADILRWAFAGVVRLYNHGGFSTGAVNVQRHNKMFFHADTIEQFLSDDDFVIKHPVSAPTNKRAKRSELFTTYLEWGRSGHVNGKRLVSKATFLDELAKRGVIFTKNNGVTVCNSIELVKR